MRYLGRNCSRAASHGNTICAKFLLALAAMFLGFQGDLATASPPSGTDSIQATTSDAARHDALQSIPLEKLSSTDRAKVSSVLSNISIFRRLPVRVADCDPDMYLFLLRHPDVVVNIWEIMKVSRLQMRQLDDNLFQISEPAGATVKFQYVYQSHNVHVLYGEGSYDGPLMSRSVTGRGILVLKCGYVRETNGRYYITSRLDCFLAIEPLGAELIGKTVSPLLGKTADNNFMQTIAFVSSLSRTAEVNSRGVQRLATQLIRVQPDVRAKFSEVAADVEEKSAKTAHSSVPRRTDVAVRPDEKTER